MRKHVTYANVMATIAVFIALGGGAYAVKVSKNSVGSKQLKPGAVKLSDTATALRFKCPGGTRYHEGACIETAARSAATWINAGSACSAAGRRLPGPSELLGFAREPGITVGPAPQLEWTSSPDSAPPEVKALVVTEVGADAFVATDPVSDAHPFRCVANALG